MHTESSNNLQRLFPVGISNPWKVVGVDKHMSSAVTKKMHGEFEFVSTGLKTNLATVESLLPSCSAN